MAAIVAGIVLFCMGIIGVFVSGSLVGAAMREDNRRAGYQAIYWGLFFTALVVLAHWVAK